ncbi:hypothetical protein [Synechocystis salina]|nr:hypothetical protein [Synechocystis salina]
MTAIASYIGDNELLPLVERVSRLGLSISNGKILVVKAESFIQ